jgi:hypothetical protein
MLGARPAGLKARPATPHCAAATAALRRRVGGRQAAGMQPVDAFRLATHAGPYDTWPARTPLLHADGRPTGRTVPGYTLLHQFRVGDDWLLLTDWDCPYEEATEVLLLDAQLRLVARRSFGAPYASWMLDGVDRLGDDALRLRFVGGPAIALRVAALAPWWSPGRWRSRLRPCRDSSR